MNTNTDITTHVHRASVAGFLLRISAVLLFITGSLFLTSCEGENPTDVVKEKTEYKFYQKVKILAISPSGVPTIQRKSYFTMNKDRDFHWRSDDSIWVSYRKIERVRDAYGRHNEWVRYGRSVEYKLNAASSDATKDQSFKVGDTADFWVGFTTRTLRNGETYTEVTAAEIRPLSNTPEPAEIFDFN